MSVFNPLLSGTHGLIKKSFRYETIDVVANLNACFLVGIQLAEVSTLPTEIIEDARNLVETLSARQVYILIRQNMVDTRRKRKKEMQLNVEICCFGRKQVKERYYNLIASDRL